MRGTFFTKVVVRIKIIIFNIFKYLNFLFIKFIIIQFNLLLKLVT